MTPPPPTTTPTVSPVAPPTQPRQAVGPVSGGLLVLVAMLLVAVNLRAAVTSLGALLDEVRGGLGLSATMAGFVTTLPTIAFAGLGALTPWLVRRFAPARVLVVAMLALAVGQVLRVLTDSPLVFVLRGRWRAATCSCWADGSPPVTPRGVP